VKRAVVEVAAGIVRDTRAPTYARLAACKTLVAADQADIRREAIEHSDDRTDRALALQAARAAMQTPQARSILSQLTRLMTTPEPPAAPSDRQGAPPSGVQPGPSPEQ
jgi:hypothetical protein